MLEKVCAIPYRTNGNSLEILAFLHPSAGKQFVKGTIEAGEAPTHAACRELLEESGEQAKWPPTYLGQTGIGSPPIIWHFFAFSNLPLRDAWDHWTKDGGGHIFTFFWHPVADDLHGDWHHIFHQAFRFIRAELPGLKTVDMLG